MTYNSRNGEPKFIFKSLRESDTESYKLRDKISRKLYHAVEDEGLLEILDELGEEPPQEWTEI
jgi:hypothetical protein